MRVSLRFLLCAVSGFVLIAGPLADGAAAAQPMPNPPPSISGNTRVGQTAFDESTAGEPAGSGPTGVAQTGSSVQLTTSRSSVLVNQTVVLAATVIADASGESPAGSVTFTSGAAAIAGCSDVAVTVGGQSQTVVCSTSLPAGQAHLAAAFTPSSGSVVLGSTSPTVTLPVERDPTHIALRVAKQVMAGTRLTYSATVSVPSESAHTFQPTGFVEFLDHGKPIFGCAKQRMTKLAAACSARYVLPGEHAITAGYRGDANFGPATSAGSALNVTPIPITGEIAATLQWTFYFTPSYTEVVHLILSGIPFGASVQLGCHGHGCPFASRREPVPTAAACVSPIVAACPSSTLSLTSSLAGRPLGVGAQITVMIAHANYVGKYYSFTVQARVQPRVWIACLAPDSPFPGMACAFGRTSSGAG